MNIINYERYDLVNGIGARVIVWLSGCSHGCDGCFSVASHNPKSGTLFTEEDKVRLFDDLSKPYISGLTWSGGDPLHRRNIEEVANLSKQIKEELPDKTIWLYTGYTFAQIKASDTLCKILPHIDVLIDGKYDKTLEPVQFRGSSNQQIIDVKKSLAKGAVVLYDLKQ